MSFIFSGYDDCNCKCHCYEERKYCIKCDLYEHEGECDPERIVLLNKIKEDKERANLIKSYRIKFKIMKQQELNKEK